MSDAIDCVVRDTQNVFYATAILGAGKFGCNKLTFHYYIPPVNLQKVCKHLKLLRLGVCLTVEA